MRTPPFLLLLGVAPLLALACSKQNTQAGPVVADRGRATSSIQTDDQSRCDHKQREDREAIETASQGALLHNVRRVYQLTTYGEERRRVLVCREVDVNQDGVKDVVRLYNSKGEVESEEADSDYDGRMDTWLSFTGGRLTREMRDTNGDGKPDVWKFYVQEDSPAARENPAKGALKLQRIQRDLNFDEKPDVWEFYEQGRLERVGIDLDFDGKVDRWDHDAVARQTKRSEGPASGAAPASSAAPTSPPDDN